MQTQEQDSIAAKKALLISTLDRVIAEAVKVESEKGTEEGMKVLDKGIALETKYRHLL